MADSVEVSVSGEGSGRPDRARVSTLEALGALRSRLGQRAELRAVEALRQRVWKRDAEARIVQALATLPESAGPLNSQGLVAKALMALDERAPEYLEHLASYLDTLLWLEEQGK